MVDILTYAMCRHYADTAVEKALTSVYTYRGQCTNAELAGKPKENGAVYEITDNGTFTRGTDVVCSNGTWQAMAGQLHVAVIDSLTSTSTTDALSAAMGKALKDYYDALELRVAALEEKVTALEQGQSSP